MAEETKLLESQLQKAEKKLERAAQNLERAKMKHAEAVRAVKGLKEYIEWSSGKSTKSAESVREHSAPKNTLADDAAQILREHGSMTVKELVEELRKMGRTTTENSVSSALSRKKGELVMRVKGTRRWKPIKIRQRETN